MSFLIHHPDLDGPPRQVPEHTLASYAARGWVLTEPERDPYANTALSMPARNASAPQWKTYAVVAGVPYAEAMAATRDELADRFRPAPKTPEPPAPPAPGKGTDKPKES